MLKREELILEFWKRVASVDSVSYSARNPVVKPNVTDMPVCNIFDFPAKKIAQSGDSRKRAPIIKFETTVVLELYVAGTTDADSTNEMFVIFTDILKAIFTDGSSLGERGCSISLEETSRVFRPPIGGHVAGVGSIFSISYAEDFNNL